MRVFKGIDVLVAAIVAAIASLWLNVSGIRLSGGCTRRIEVINYGHIWLESCGSPGDGSASRGHQPRAMHMAAIAPLCLKLRSKSKLLGVARTMDETMGEKGVFAPQKVDCIVVENC